MAAFPILVLLVLVGGLPALALTRSALLAIPAAAALVVALSGVAGIVAVGSSLPFLPTWCVVAGGADVAAGAALWAERRKPLTVEWSEVGLLLLAAAPTVLVLVVLRPVPMQWDPRSIWWFHASWFTAGTETVRAAIADPVLIFSHVDYPIGVPAAIGAFWALTGGEDLRRAELFTSVLTLVAVLGPVAVLVLEWGATRRRLVSVLGGALVAIAMLGLGQAFALFGYVDVLCAAFVVTGAVALTFRPTDRATVGLAGCALAAAGMTKAEGAVFALVVLGVHLVHRHDRWRTVSALALLVVIPSLAWRSIVFGINPHPASEIDVGNVVEVVRFSGMRMRRLCRAAGHLLRYSPPLVAASVVALLTGRVARSKPGYRRAGVLMIAAWATMFALAMIYAAGDTDLGYWLRTSAERIVTTPVLLALVATAECVLTLVDPRVAASRAGRST